MNNATQTTTQTTQLTEQTQKHKTSKFKETLCFSCTHCTGAPAPEFQALDASLGACLAQTQNPSQQDPSQTDNPYIKTHTVCPWAAHGAPVPGWTATSQKLKVSPDQTVDSYHVTACPFYQADLEARINQMDRDTVRRLIGVSSKFVMSHRKLCKQLVYEYLRALDRLKDKGPDAVEKFRAGGKAARLELRKQIVKRHKHYAQCDVEMLNEDINALKEQGKYVPRSFIEELNVKTKEVADCDVALKTIQRVAKNGHREMKTNGKI